MERSFEMDFAIQELERWLDDRKFWLSGVRPDLKQQFQSEIDGLTAAIAILKQHSTKAPAAPPEFVRDYPHASD
jgi:hypothetical protein